MAVVSRSSAANALDLVLRLGRGDGLPLHVARCIGPATGEWLDVIDYVAGSTVWKASLSREGVTGCRAALNAAWRVTGRGAGWGDRTRGRHSTGHNGRRRPPGGDSSWRRRLHWRRGPGGRERQYLGGHGR